MTFPSDENINEQTTAEPAQPGAAAPVVDNELARAMNKALIDLTLEVKALRKAQQQNAPTVTKETRHKIRDL